MPTPVEQFLGAKRIAVVGVSRSAEKFGTKVYRLLIEHEYEVYGINPNMTELDGQPVYPNLADLSVPVDAVVVIVPPAAAINVIKTAAEQGIRLVWLQPGSESDEATEVAERLGISLIRDTCIMLRSKAARAACQP